MIRQINRRQLLFAAAVPFSKVAAEQSTPQCPSLVELAPLLATAEAESNDGFGYSTRLGAIQWSRDVVLVYARCEVNLAEHLLDALGAIGKSPLAFSWARTGGAWCLFANGNVSDVRGHLAAIVPADWTQSTDRAASVCWGSEKVGEA